MLRLRLVDVVAAGLRVQRLITRLTDARHLVYLIVFGLQHGSLLLVYYVCTTWPTTASVLCVTTSVPSVQPGSLLLVYHVYNVAHYY